MDWNECSDDSWLEDNSQNSDQEKTAQQKKQQQKTSQAEKPAASENSEQKQVALQNKKQKEHVKKTVSRPQGKKFPTDQQIIEQYEKDEVQQKKRLKIINLKVEEEKKMIEDMEKEKKIKKLKRPQNIQKGPYVISFWNKEDLIKFIKEKVEKKYKFHVAIYIISQNQRKFIAEREKQREQLKAQKEKQEKNYQQQKQKKQSNYRGQRQDKQYRKVKSYRSKDKQQPKKGDSKGYRGQKQQGEYKHKQSNKDTKNRKSDRYDKDQGEHKKQHQIQKQGGKNRHNQQKKQKHEKKHKQAVKNLQIKNKNMNVVTVLSDEADPSDAAQWIKHQKLNNQFNLIILEAPGKLNEYVEKVSNQTYKLINFGLTTQLNDEIFSQKPQELFKFVLQTNKKPKQRKRPMVYLEKASQQHFENLQKCNIHIIGKKEKSGEKIEFDQKQYSELFKKNYPKIVAKWPNWVLQASGKNIEKLLKISEIFKKEVLPKNEFKFTVGCQGEEPFLKFQICDLNKTKFKFDTSAINSHLKN